MQGQLYSTKREQRRSYVVTSNISMPSSQSHLQSDGEELQVSALLEISGGGET